MKGFLKHLLHAVLVVAYIMSIRYSIDNGYDTVGILLAVFYLNFADYAEDKIKGKLEIKQEKTNE